MNKSVLPLPIDPPVKPNQICGCLPPSYGNMTAAKPEDGKSRAAPAARIPRWKRIFELCLVIFTAWLWLPLMLLIACVVKIASPGPVFYRQQRVGYQGYVFMMLKFRSMRMNAETRTHEDYVEWLMRADRPMTKLDSTDARLIPCGRILRATGLDELPQIFNVIRGEMSLVGPRPCTPGEFQRYEGWQRDRVNAAPGVTGFWQVNGKNRTTFNQMIGMDIFYVDNMSLWLDLEIILKTLPAMVRQTFESYAASLGRDGQQPLPRLSPVRVSVEE
jgi:lipopolysaccharide/colanic/teichoic acid biosynthesis glycosyltransferase